MTELNGTQIGKILHAVRRRILTQVHLSVEERKKLKLMSQEDERTMSDWIRKIIRDEWKRRGKD